MFMSLLLEEETSFVGAASDQIFYVLDFFKWKHFGLIIIIIY